AIGWYEQRLSIEQDADTKAIMANAQQEEFKHFAMDLEFLLRKKKKWRIACQGVLFQDGDIVELGEKAEEAEDDAEFRVVLRPEVLVHLGVAGVAGAEGEKHQPVGAGLEGALRRRRDADRIP